MHVFSSTASFLLATSALLSVSVVATRYDGRLEIVNRNGYAMMRGAPQQPPLPWPSLALQYFPQLRDRPEPPVLQYQPFPEVLEQVLREGRIGFPHPNGPRYPDARVTYFYRHLPDPNVMLEEIRNHADVRRFITLGEPNPIQPRAVGTAYAFPVQSSDFRDPRRRLFAFISILRGEDNAGPPRVFFNGFATVDNAAGVEWHMQERTLPLVRFEHPTSGYVVAPQLGSVLSTEEMLHDLGVWLQDPFQPRVPP